MLRRLPYSKPPYHKRGVAAFGRATSLEVSLVSALNEVNIVAVTTILVLHVGNGRCEHVWLDIMCYAIRWVIGNILSKYGALSQRWWHGAMIHSSALGQCGGPKLVHSNFLLITDLFKARREISLRHRHPSLSRGASQKQQDVLFRWLHLLKSILYKIGRTPRP